jgi:lipoprotein-releasing system permease protein
LIPREMDFALDVALRYLGSRKRASVSLGTAFAVLGVALGVAALATVMSVTSGFRAEFREKVLGVNAHVLVLKRSTDFREYPEVMARVAEVPGVAGVAPFALHPTMLRHGDATETGVMLKGIDPARSLGVGAPPGTRPVLSLPQQILGCEDTARTAGADAAIACGASKLTDLRLPGAKPAERRVTDTSPAPLDAPEPRDERPQDTETAKEGAITPSGGYKSVLPDDDGILPADVEPDAYANAASVRKLPGIIVGATLAKRLDIAVGDTVTVTSPTIGFLISGSSLRAAVARRYRVIALFEAGFEQYDAKWVYVDLYEAQAFSEEGDTVTGVEITVHDIERARLISKQIAALLAGGLYHTMDWEELNHGLFTALWIQEVTMSVVLALIILVAAFTVVATLVMVVLDKTKEIAVMKAMGATDGAVLRIFLYQGGLIGLVGTTLGLLLGLAVCKGLFVYGFPLDPKVYFIAHLPVEVRPTELAITGQIALATCVEATVVPSLYAACIAPADGLCERGGPSSARGRSALLSAWFLALHYAGTLATLVALLWLETGAEAPVSRGALVAVALVAAAASVAALAMLVAPRRPRRARRS